MMLAKNWASVCQLFTRWVVRIVVFICLLNTIGAPPVKPRKHLDLKEELGPMFEAFTKLQTELKVMYLKELAAASPEERPKIHDKWKETMRQHAPVHSPGSEQQLKRTWREDDEMDEGSFSMESLFKTHDFDNDGFLSHDEIRALYYSEVERAYPDHDNAEEKMRLLMDTEMLGSILKRIDTNKDGKISFVEFINYRPDSDDNFDWTDEDDLPDLEHAKDDNLLVEAVRKDLEQHPNDSAGEKLMHELSGMKVLHELKAPDIYSVHKPHQDATLPPAPHNPPQTAAPPAATKP